VEEVLQDFVIRGAENPLIKDVIGHHIMEVDEGEEVLDGQRDEEAGFVDTKVHVSLHRH
jgi:hypothetical protein